MKKKTVKVKEANPLLLLKESPEDRKERVQNWQSTRTKVIPNKRRKTRNQLRRELNEEKRRI